MTAKEKISSDSHVTVSVTANVAVTWLKVDPMTLKTLTEETKNEISRLAHTTNMTPEEIALKLGVSYRSVFRYKDYGQGEIQTSKESFKEARHWICSRCGHTTNQKGTVCPYCQTGPFDSVLAEAGTPKYQAIVQAFNEPPQVEAKPPEPHNLPLDEIEPPNEQDFQDPASQVEDTDSEEKEEENHYHCPECGHTEPKPFNPCPECETELGWD